MNPNPFASQPDPAATARPSPGRRPRRGALHSVPGQPPPPPPHNTLTAQLHLPETSLSGQPCLFPQPPLKNSLTDYLETFQQKYYGRIDALAQDSPTTFLGHTSLSPTPSSVSAISSLSSLSTYSPTNQTCTSRNPSPLRTVASADTATITDESGFVSTSTLEESGSVSTVPGESGFICLGPRCDVTFASDTELAAHIREQHTHICSWAGCSAGSFGNREALVWHVEAHHLLICPVSRCRESFATRKLMTCHIEVAHPDKAVRSGNGKRKASVELEEEPTGQLKVRRVDDARLGASRVEDKALKEVLSVAVSKKKCREQLKAVLEKRAKRLSHGPSTPRTPRTPRTADSPTSEARSLLDSAPFPLVWEHGVLPFLVEFIPKWCGPGHAVSVTRRPSASQSCPGRRINIITQKPVSRARRIIIVSHVRDLLPVRCRHQFSFCFSTGEVSRLVWARGLGKAMPDEVCSPRNPFHFKSPCMGDSIGVPDTSEMRGATATLGPCLLVEGGSFWLANLHPFIDAVQGADEACAIQHPSPDDRQGCSEKVHDALSAREEDEFNLGRLTAWSGFDLKTTRLSHDPYWEDMDKEAPMVVTDWALISSSSRTANISRRFPQENNPLLKEPLVKSIGHVTPGAIVNISSRTSGYQRGVVCEVPAYLDGTKSGGNGTGTATREWFIEALTPDEDDNEWIRSGVGVPGDSGAAVVDADSNALIGQLWGRNKYWGPGHRIAFFTPMSDVLDDVQERCRIQSRPALPQYRDEADRYPVYPSCRQCYDLRAYLDSRRSSRESMLSMIPPPRHESDQDLTSIEAQSELATPKDHQGYWLRHIGPDDSFGSPTAMGMGTGFNLPGTPGGAMDAGGVRSPYAQMIDDGDLLDLSHGGSEVLWGESSMRKRTAPAQGRLGEVQGEGSKRQRMA